MFLLKSPLRKSINPLSVWLSMVFWFQSGLERLSNDHWTIDKIRFLNKAEAEHKHSCALFMLCLIVIITFPTVCSLVWQLSVDVVKNLSFITKNWAHKMKSGFANSYLQFVCVVSKSWPYFSIWNRDKTNIVNIALNKYIGRGLSSSWSHCICFLSAIGLSIYNTMLQHAVQQQMLARRAATHFLQAQNKWWN